MTFSTSYSDGEIAMNKKMGVWALVLGCFVLTAGVADAAVKKNQAECTVESVEGAKVVLNCTEVGKDIAAGDKVKFIKIKAAVAKPVATEPTKPVAAPAPAKPALQAEAKAVAKAPAQKKLVYTVRRGDTLFTIAQRYKVLVRELKKWNELKGDAIQVGQQLVIYK
jgi:LysM repeat protein